jgi:hypothetical protein
VSPAEPVPRSRRGPLLGAVAVVAAAAAVFVSVRFAERLGDRGPSTPPTVADPDQTLLGFSGELAAADGGRILLRLTPMHAEPSVQAFDAAAIRRRLSLGSGEPWRLRIAWQPAVKTEAAALPPELALNSLSIADERGVALAVLASDRGAPRPGTRDPLATLLGPPSAPLTPGHEVDVFLWGRAPESGARIEGLAPPDATTGSAAAIALAPQAIRRAELGGSLARLDSPLAGNTAERGASTRPQAPPERDGARASRL